MCLPQLQVGHAFCLRAICNLQLHPTSKQPKKECESSTLIDPYFNSFGPAPYMQQPFFFPPYLR